MENKKIKLTASESIPYSFTTEKGELLEGYTHYAMLVPVKGAPRIEKLTEPLDHPIYYDSLKDIPYDYKRRIIVM